MKHISLFISLLALAVSGCREIENSSGSEPVQTTQDTVAQAQITWIYSLQDGLAMAQQSGMPLMVDFFADWCHWCRKLDSETYTDKSVAELSRRFICVKIDTEKDRSSSAQYRVSGLPTILFLDKSGNTLNEVVGFRDASGMLSEMETALQRVK